MKNSNFENSSFNKDKQDDFIKLSFAKKDEEHNKLIIEYTKLSLRNKELEKKLQEKDKQIQYYKDKYESRNYNEIMINMEESNNLNYNIEKSELMNKIDNKDDIIMEQKHIIEKQKLLIQEKEEKIKSNDRILAIQKIIIKEYHNRNFNENKIFADKNIIDKISEVNNFNEDDKSQDGTCNSTYFNKKTK